MVRDHPLGVRSPAVATGTWGSTFDSTLMYEEYLGQTAVSDMGYIKRLRPVIHCAFFWCIIFYNSISKTLKRSFLGHVVIWFKYITEH